MTLKNFCNFQTSRSREKIKERRRSGLLSPLAHGKYEEVSLDRQEREFQKTKEEENILYQALLNNEFLKNVLTDVPLQNVVDCMFVKTVQDGDFLLEQGKITSYGFVSLSGTFSIFENDKLIETFKGIRVFGEVAILHSAKASQTVKAVSSGVVGFLDCAYFKTLTINSKIEKQDEIVYYLKNVPSLSKASEASLYTLTDLCKTQYYPVASILVKEGEIVNKFFIVTAGTATILTRDSSKKVEKLSRGNFFGETSLLKETVSTYTIVADLPGVKCLILHRNDFLEHFSDLHEFLQGKKYDDTPFLQYASLELKNLKKMKTLGVGGFGRVELVQDIKNKDDIFALKCMKKNEINSQNHINQVYNEKNIQNACNSPFIVKLYRTFKDSKYIYFLLEPCMGGDLWNLLRRQRNKSFDTDAAKFYAACIVEAFDYLHSRNIVYRDLKPENVMVSSNGYLKITDFGFAKKIGKNDKAYSFVGTAEYVSPEQIQNLPHNKGVDYWALGVFIYELLVGKSPFRNEEHNDLKTYKAILKGIDFISFPYMISPRARNLIKKLCRPLSIDRLGCMKDGVKDIQKHPWFSKLDWEKLKILELDPPIRICLNGHIDTRYFENFKEENIRVVDDFSTWDKDF